MRICAMQPAFIPPASYFRLFAATDLFVILDNVQFDRRWYTHRQQLTDRNGKKQWLTLPIKHTPRDTTRILDLEWADDYQDRWLSELDKFASVEHFPIPQGLSPVMFICTGLFNTCNTLGIPLHIATSSAVPIPDDLRGQARIIAICEFLKATTYVNSPGGTSLYDPKAFADKNIKLEFLPEWTGDNRSVIERLTDQSPEEIREDIYEQI